jgi:hypothetical protein
MNRIRLVLGSVSAVALSVGILGLAQAQQAPGGTVTYWVTADTASGMAGMAAGGSASSILAAMSGRGQASYVHNLQLQLGSGQRPTGEANAEHLPPAGLQAGASLPLLTPRNERRPEQPG